MLFYPKRQLTLNTFFPKKGNQRARAAGIQFIAAQQASPDTLVVAGRPGSGKTHLLHALANFAKHNEAIHGIACLSAVQFGDEVMRGIFYCDLDIVLHRFAQESFLALDDADHIAHQPVLADALVRLCQMRQNNRKRTLLTATLSLATGNDHPLTRFLNNQLAVRLN